MIISVPTQQGMYTFCLNASLLKLIASAAIVLMLLTGYCIVQLSAFILSATPSEFLRIILFTLFTIGLILVARFVLSQKGATR